MVDSFEYVADSDSKMEMVAVNNNNLTQYVNIDYLVIPPIERSIEKWIETWPTVFVGFWISGIVLVVLFWRWKREKPVTLDFNP
jgi:hypothetical protein